MVMRMHIKVINSFRNWLNMILSCRLLLSMAQRQAHIDNVVN